MMHERLFGHNSSALSSILRNTVNRIGSSYIVHGSGGRGSDAWRHSFGGRGGSSGMPGHPVSSLLASNAIKVKGRQLLDQEGLSCLLIILFIDDPKINTTRYVNYTIKTFLRLNLKVSLFMDFKIFLTLILQKM